MINLTAELNKKFNNKYDFLKLLNVVYESDASLCVVTFLYPYDIEEITSEDHQIIENYVKELFSLHASIKVKLKRSFLDEKLIVSELYEFFKENKKGLVPYISQDNISSSYEGRDVSVVIKLNQDVLSLVDEFELKNEIKEYLEKLFIANIDVSIVENDETLPDNIECDDILPTSKKSRRYKVSIEKKIIGDDIFPMPEFISDIKSAKSSVILSGFMKNKTQKKFTIKKGKNAGKEKSLYTFMLKDQEGEIECVYFCSKNHEKDLEDLEDMSMLLCVGDVKLGLTGKLTYYIRKMFLAGIVDEKEEEKSNDTYKFKKVVFPDMLPRNSQSNLFEIKPTYNDFIMSNNIVVFDIETTGLNPEVCEITEIGAVKIEHGEVTERFSSFAKPKDGIPEEVQNLTHITNEMVADAPRVEDVVHDFFQWCQGCIISGYNIIGFDMKFIQKVGERIGCEFKNEIVDTMLVVRQSKLRTTNYKLGTVVKALDLTLVDAHRAFNDAYATAQVLMELNRTDKKY